MYIDELEDGRKELQNIRDEFNHRLKEDECIVMSINEFKRILGIKPDLGYKLFDHELNKEQS